MSGIAATFWLVFVTVVPDTQVTQNAPVIPGGTKYQYIQEFGSSEKCYEVLRNIRQSDGIDWYQYGARCTDDKLPANVYEIFIPRQG